MKNSSKTIEAVISIEISNGNPPWEENPPWLVLEFENNCEYYEHYIRIHAGISDEEIGSVMISACDSSSSEIIKGKSSETLKTFVADEGFVLSGGLLFKENDEIKVAPGCCCGLEDWKDWLDVSNGRVDIWTGHDPNSLIEINNGKIQIWEDIKTRNESYSTEFTVEEMIEKLEIIEKDLKDFLFRLGQWMKQIEPELEKTVVSHFAKNINIKL